MYRVFAEPIKMRVGFAILSKPLSAWGARTVDYPVTSVTFRYVSGTLFDAFFRFSRNSKNKTRHDAFVADVSYIRFLKLVYR